MLTFKKFSTHVELSLLEGTNSNLQRSVAHGHKHYVSGFLVLCGQVLLVDAIAQGSCCGVVEQPKAVQTGNGTSVKQPPTLSIGEERGYLREDRRAQFKDLILGNDYWWW